MHTARSTMKRQLECSFLAVTTLLVSRVQTPTHPHSTPARAVFSKLKRDPSPTREGKEEWGKEVSPMLSSLTNGGVGCSLALMAEPPQGREYSSCDGAPDRKRSGIPRKGCGLFAHGACHHQQHAFAGGQGTTSQVFLNSSAGFISQL